MPTVAEFTFFTLILGRMAGIFSSIPLFGGKRVPMRIKAITTLTMALVCYPILRAGGIPPLPEDTVSLVLLVARETLIGITLGMLGQVLFAAVEFCGQIVGMQMGLSIVSEFDPSQGNQASVMSIFQGLLALLLFVSLGVHHFFIRTIIESYTPVPIGAWHMTGGLMQYLITLTGQIFVLAVKLAAPVMVALLATSVALGIMARAFPQMNVFMVSMPLNIGIGFLVLGMSLTIFLHTLQGAFNGISQQIKVLLKLMGG